MEASRNGNTYTLPAQVTVEKETIEISDEKSKTYIHYYIEKVFFSNGEYIDINNWEPVEIGKASYHYGPNDDMWTFTLLNKHAYSPCVAETNNANWLDIAFLLIEVTSVVFLLLVVRHKEALMTKGR